MGKFVERLETRRLLCGFSPNVEAHALTSAVDLALAEAIPQTWMINFQNGSAATPAGYVADTGKVFGDRGNGHTFGWNVDNASNTRDRNSSAAPDQRYDTLTHTQLYGTRSWEMAVPNGQYQVRIVGGDPSYFGSTIRYNAEGTLVVSGSQTSANKFVDGTNTVTVSDGRLSITNASGSANNKICFIEVTQVSANPSATLGISVTDAYAAEPGANTGVFKVTRSGASTASSLTVGYTISGSAGNGSDYNTLSGSVTIAAGATSANITVTPKNDSIVESTETVTLTLKPLSGYSLTNSSASIDIVDDDAPASTGLWPTSWTRGPNMPKARWESSSVLMDGKIWSFGGWMSASSTGTQQVDVFDTETNTWSTLKNYAPVPHTHSALAADPANHAIYFLGGLFGSYPGTPTNKVWKFDTITKTWTDLPAMPENHSSGAAAFVNNELHYIGGVMDDRVTNTGRHIVLNLNNLAAGWQSAPSLPDARDHMGVVVLNGKIVIVGGEFGHDKLHDAQSLVDQYDPVAKTWTRLASLPIPKSHIGSSTFVHSGKIYAAGGQLGNQKGTDEVAMYDPALNKWTTIGRLPTILEGPVVVRTGNRIIITSGNSGTGPTNTTYFGNV